MDTWHLSSRMVGSKQFLRGQYIAFEGEIAWCICQITSAVTMGQGADCPVYLEG